MIRVGKAGMERLYSFTIISLLCAVQLGGAEGDADISIQVAEMTNVKSVLTKIPQELKLPSTEKRTYQILSGQRYTEVGHHDGILKVKKQMDREKLCPDNRDHCYIIVTVAMVLVNGRNSAKPKLVKIQIEVTDINDNEPYFDNKLIEKMMSESADVHTSIRLDSAVDPDFGKNSIQGYNLVSSSGTRSKDRFFELEVIDSFDGVKIPKLKLKKGLDRERKGVHELFLEAFDGGTPALTGTATVQINITDSNDNDPEFEQENYNVNVKEHEKEGVQIIQVVANDKDIGRNGMIVYKFPSAVSAEDREIFALDPHTGVISVKNSAKLDFETRKVHHLTIEATDMGPSAVSAYTTVTVNVKDVNDNKPQVEVSFMTSEAIKEAPFGMDFDAIIMENIDVDRFIAFVTITDKDGGDNGTVSCDIPHEGIFSLTSIEENTGRFVLKINRKLDRERKNSYDLPIDAWDLGTPPQTNTRVLKLKVGDVNDNAPRFFHKEFKAKVSETATKGAIISSLQAKDTDERPGPNSNVTYSLMDRPDFVTKNGVNYLLTKVFKIDPVTGDVRLTIDNVLDAEVELNPGYLIVLAKDNGTPSLNTTTKLKITVIDENDNSPIFEEESYLFEVEEHSSDGKYIGQVKATDLDKSDNTNGRISYTIERFKSNDRIASPEDESMWLEMFQVDAKTGYIHFYGNRTKLDREAYSNRPITISVVATDNGSPRRHAEATVKIVLTDINDNKPLVLYPDGQKDITLVQIVPKNFEAGNEMLEDGELLNTLSPDGLQSDPVQSWFSIVRYEESNISDSDSFLPVTLTQVQATDMDEGKNALLSYAIIDGDENRYFDIDPQDGNLTFAEDIDLDNIKFGCHVLKILVSDLGEPKLHSDAFVNLFLSRDGPEVVNITNAMRECQTDPLFPHALDDDINVAGLDEFTLYIIIGFGVLIFIILLIIAIVLIKCHCCDKHKKSRSYNCQQGNTWNNTSGYDEDKKKNIRKRGSSRRSYNGQGTVDSRSSFHSEWTASQTQIPPERAEKVRVLPDLQSVGSAESQGVHDSGTGDSVSGDAYHPANYGDVPDHQTYLPNHDAQYIHPHNSMSPMQYGSPMNELPPQHMVPYVEHPNMYGGGIISTKCTHECLIYGHGDHCWMPDSLLRTQAQGPIDMMNPDRVIYQNHPEVHGLRYHGDPNTPYYYDPGQKFSQLSSNEGSEHLSYTKGHGEEGFHHPGMVDGMQHHPGYQHPPIHAPSPHPHQMMYQNDPDRERAYINLQGYDTAQNPPEEMHSNLSSASSNTGNNPYGAALPQNTQRYRPEPNHPQMFYASPGNSRYDMVPTTQGYMTGMHDPTPIHYTEDYSAANLLPPVSTGPGDYGHHWDHNRAIPSEQQPLLHRQDFPNRSGRTSNPDPAEQERLLNHNPDGAKVPDNPGDANEKLRTIDEHDADIATTEIDGLLL